MSKFITTIPVDVNAIVALLPKRASLVQTRYDHQRSEVVVEWEDDDLVTPFTYPIEFSEDRLRMFNKQPEVKHLPLQTGFRKAPAPAPAPAPAKPSHMAARVGTRRQRAVAVETLKGRTSSHATQIADTPM